jgi:hypothetical protein
MTRCPREDIRVFWRHSQTRLRAMRLSNGSFRRNAQQESHTWGTVSCTALKDCNPFANACAGGASPSVEEKMPMHRHAVERDNDGSMGVVFAVSSTSYVVFQSAFGARRMSAITGGVSLSKLIVHLSAWPEFWLIRPRSPGYRHPVVFLHSRCRPHRI